MENHHTHQECKFFCAGSFAEYYRLCEAQNERSSHQLCLLQSITRRKVLFLISNQAESIDHFGT